MHAVLRVQELVCPATGDAPLHEGSRVVLPGIILTNLGERLQLVVVLRRCKGEVCVSNVLSCLPSSMVNSHSSCSLTTGEMQACEVQPGRRGEPTRARVGVRTYPDKKEVVDSEGKDNGDRCLQYACRLVHDCRIQIERSTACTAPDGEGGVRCSLLHGAQHALRAEWAKHKIRSYCFETESSK